MQLAITFVKIFNVWVGFAFPSLLLWLDGLAMFVQMHGLIVNSS